jgi:hypothetical protein
MKYLRRQNLNTGNVLDDTVLQRADGNIELNPTQKVIINGDLEFGTGFTIPGPEVTNVIYVTLDGDDDNTGLGEGPGQAKRTLKSALEVADQGTTIFVRSGEYYEDNPLRVPPKVSIIGDNLRRTIIRPLNGPQSADVTYAEKTDEYVTLTTDGAHGLLPGQRIRVRVQLSTIVNVNSVSVGNSYKIVSSGNTNFIAIGAATNNVGEVFTATAAGAGTGTVAWVELDEVDVNILEVPSANLLVYRQTGPNVAGTAASGKIKWAPDLFLVNSQNYLTGMVFKGLAAPAYCVNIDDDAIVDTSPYIQNCSNINGPWMRNGVEWIPFVTTQPDLLGNPVSGPRPLLDDEIDPTQVDQYGIDIEGAGGGMLIDGDRYSSESPIKSMVADAFTQVAQGAVGFHVTNFGYMQLVSCFSVFCYRAFFTTRGGYLSVSNSVIDFGDEGFVAEGYYPDPYSSGLINQDYYSSVVSVSVTPGQGYTSAPLIVIDPPTTPGGVQAEAVASIDPILGIVNAVTVTVQGNGYDFQPNVTISGGGASTNATGVANLLKNLFIDVNELSNKPQIGSLMLLDNDPQSYYVVDVSDDTFTFKYDEQKCRRDVGIILDSVLADMLFNSTYRSVSAGLSYLRSYSSKVTSLQKAQTIAGLTEARDQALLLTSNATAQARIQAGFDTVINIINIGSSAAPLVVTPAPPLFEEGYPQAASILLANKLFIQDEIVAWIADNYPALSYNVTTCRRDIGFIVDAMCYDLIYGGNTQTINAALSYKEGSVIINEIEETQAAYEYWKTIIGNILKNIPVTTTTSGQNTSLPLGSPVDPNATKVSAEELLQIIIDVIDNGPGYIPENPILPFYENGDATLLIERNNILDDTLIIQEQVIDYLNGIYGGVARVYIFPPITSVVAGTEPKFHNVSTISTSSTALEYVGAGVTYNALPFFGGEPVPAKERIERDSGKCFTVSSDQIGNYRIGEFFNVNSLTGDVTIDAEKLNLSGLASIGPFRRNGTPVGEQLREVSNNANLIASNGIADPNTVPTQSAVQTYVENRYLNKVASVAQTVESDIAFIGDVEIRGGDLTTNQTIFNLLNATAITVNAFGAATAIEIGAATGTLTINNDQVIFNSTNSIQIPVGTTSDRDATPEVGQIRYNSELSSFEGFGPGGTWGSLGGVKDVDGNTYIIPESSPGANENILYFYNDGTLTLTLEETSFNLSNGVVVNINDDSDSNSTTTGSLVIAGGVGIALNLNVGSDITATGNIAVNGGNITSSESEFTLLGEPESIQAFKSATDISIGFNSGTTTITNNLNVDLNTTLGLDTDSLNTLNGKLTVNLKDNTADIFTIKEDSNNYIKINTNNSLELITFGSLPTYEFLNDTDASSTSVASTTFAGGVGIAKKLFVGTDLDVDGNATIGDATTDTHTVTGSVTIVAPDNTAAALQIKENAQAYFTVVTTNGSESVTFESIPRVLINNTTESTDKDTGAVVVEGGVGIEKNLNVGGTMGVTGNVTLTGDLAVNGGDLTTTQTTFNLVNTIAETVNFAGAATDVQIGAATGTTNVNNNLDVDGDVNIDGGDLTTNQTTFNLVNTNAETVNFAGAATDVQIGAATGTTNINNNLDVDGDVNIDGNDLTTTQTTFNLLNTTATTINVGNAATTINVGSSSTVVNIGELRLTTDLAVQYGGTGRSTFTQNGVIYGNTADGLLVTAASNPGSNATTSYGILTTDINNVPVWTDVIDGGSY